ncbi:MAG: hypothetical protein ACYTAF_16175, partial [Planctomycetota bacterium]
MRAHLRRTHRFPRRLIVVIVVSAILALLDIWALSREIGLPETTLAGSLVSCAWILAHALIVFGLAARRTWAWWVAMFVYWSHFLLMLLLCGAVLFLSVSYLDMFGPLMLQSPGAVLLLLVP